MTPKRLTQLLSDTQAALEAEQAKNQGLRRTVRQLKAAAKVSATAQKPSEERSHQDFLAEQHREMLQTRCQELWEEILVARERLAVLDGTPAAPLPERNGAQEGH